MRDTIKSYRDLVVWRKALDLCEITYRLTAKLPRDERYALSDQLRRAAVSIPSNIAEGRSRQGEKEFLHFLSIAQGSVAELETQLMLAVRLAMLQESDIAAALSLSDEVSKMVRSLRTKLQGGARP